MRAIEKPSGRLIGFLLIEGFPMMAFASALDPLRAANQILGREVYSWVILSLDGRSVPASCGVSVAADHALDDAPGLSTLFVIAGSRAHSFNDSHVRVWLRHQERLGCRIGGISGGSYLLARAGLLQNRRFAFHWELEAAFLEEFPELAPSQDIFVVDGNVMTCAGGVATLDLMLWLMAADVGWKVALDVSENFLYPRVREGRDPQRQSPPERFGVTNPKLADAIRYLQKNVERGRALTDLPAAVGLSKRQLERQFKKYLRLTPAKYLMELRLRRARRLLFYTTVPAFEVAEACGFNSHSYFTKVYRETYGHAPAAERRLRMQPSESHAELLGER